MKKGMQELRRFPALILGAFIYSLGLNLFVVPAGFYTGGVMGFCQIIRTLLAPVIPASFDIAGVLYYAINVPLLILAWLKIDRAFVGRTLLCVTAITVFVSIIPVRLLLEEDIIANCLVGGVIAGGGTGLMLWGGGTGGGLDIVSMMILRSHQHASVGRINLVFNCFLYGLCIVIFNVQIAIYSIVYAFICSFAIDKIHAQNIIEEVTVITKLPVEELEQDVIQKMHRGVTKLEAVGGYTDDNESLLIIVISKFEINQLISIIRSHDPRAFITVKEHTQVYGNFKQRI